MATIAQLKARLAAQEQIIASLQPGINAATQQARQAQAVLDAFQATPGVNLAQLVRARNAAAADPTNAQLQQQFAAVQQQFDARQAQYRPLLAARDAASAALFAARRPQVEAYSIAGEIEIEIAETDITQASPEAVEYLRERGELPVNPAVDPGIVSNQPTAQAQPITTQPTLQPLTQAAAATQDTVVAVNAAEPQAQFVYDENTGEMIPADSAQAQEILAEQPSVFGPEPLPAAGNNPDEVDIPAASIISSDQQQANEQAAAKVNAINQATLQSRYKQPGTSDWRVRLQLAPRSDYLYNASPPGILKPLAETNGVIFPYTPQVNTSYKANYEQYDLVHSNYRGVYYKNSRVDDVAIRGTFTAQDTREADYLLAVIHFFRSVTKMFYGKDTERGTPPPLVYLSGYGMNQFNGHPCVVSNFTYNLPDNVDYIRATNVNNYGTDLLSRRTATSAGGQAGLGATGNRILNAGLERFFPQTSPTPDTVVGSVNNTQLANYVPTKMEIDITLIPVQTRSQVSKQFSLKSFANGDLIKGGFW